MQYDSWLSEGVETIPFSIRKIMFIYICINVIIIFSGTKKNPLGFYILVISSRIGLLMGLSPLGLVSHYGWSPLGFVSSRFCPSRVFPSRHCLLQGLSCYHHCVRDHPPTSFGGRRVRGPGEAQVSNLRTSRSSTTLFRSGVGPIPHFPHLSLCHIMYTNILSGCLITGIFF